MKVVYKYKEMQSTITGTIKRPIARIQMWSNKLKKWVKVEGFLDSGADITLIPFGLGKMLGFTIDEDNVKVLGGIGEGRVSVCIVEGNVRIGNKEFNARIGWAFDNKVPVLIGRLDIFDKFNITFKERDGLIIFEEA
ncbi:MAG: hypothetical protein DRN20_02795 [Thermoplasmata archaeon]|nr:MAG: hypothetical protein DRN20_02795 [Thermoplasmata archaeon]